LFAYQEHQENDTLLRERSSTVSVPPRWYAVHTRSHFESRIASQLSAVGIENYLPSVEEIHQWKDRKRTVNIPLFPGYLFARISPIPENRLQILQTAGVAGIVSTGGNIESVADTEIEAIRTALSARLRYQPHPFLRMGDWVRVKKGALKEVEGYLLRHKNQMRLVISVSILGQSISVELDTRDVERIPRSMVPARLH
jgi:transcription antitermination factor NusG